MAYSQAYDNLAWQVARESFGDSALAQVFYRMMKQESGFDSEVVEGRRRSAAGAVGIAQFMPATAQEEGVDPLNPEEALRAAVAYLRKLISYLGGEVAKGVAAYNAGAGRVEKAVAAGGSNWVGYLPRETQTYLAITQPEGVTAMPNGTIETGGIPRPQPPYQPTGAVGQGTVAPTGQGLGFGVWIEQNDPDFPWRDRIRPDQPGLIGNAWLKMLTSQERAAKWERYNAATQGTSGVTAREEAATALDWAQAQRIIAFDEGKTYEQGRQRILDQMDEKKWTAEQAISEFNAWMRAAEEAGGRAETVYGEEMKRKVWTTPEKYYPGTEPGGPHEQMYERYGLEYKPSPGIAVETLPSQEQMYGRWHEKMGISQQTPATQGGWSGQGQGYDAAMDFLRRMNLRPGVQQGAAPAY